MQGSPEAQSPGTPVDPSNYISEYVAPNRAGVSLTAQLQDSSDEIGARVISKVSFPEQMNMSAHVGPLNQSGGSNHFKLAIKDASILTLGSKRTTRNSNNRAKNTPSKKMRSTARNIRNMVAKND